MKQIKRLLLIACILCPLAVGAVTIKDRIRTSQVKALVAECRSYEGAEVINAGRLITGAVKGAIRLAAVGDAEAREITRLLKGVKSISILDFEDCSPEDKETICSRIDRLFSGIEPLMEVHDDGDLLLIYGAVDDTASTVRDFVVYAPADGTFICMFGSVDVNKAVHIINQ